MLDFSIIDVIDILLVAILLYNMYMVMKESSSAKIFTGIILFLIAWTVISRVFEMRLLGSILDKMVNIGGIALVILFQDDIRRFFSGIGTQGRLKYIRKLFRPNKTEHKQHEHVLAIVLSCISMGKHKQGALIVLERQVQLGEFIRSGDIINADVNQRLIENIFFKNSPLHDGAMIIQGKHIRAAGCILPVSHDVGIPKSLGLRHRSALGISQKTDAIAVVVSEETGNIAVAMDGQFHLHLSAEELERFIVDNWE